MNRIAFSTAGVILLALGVRAQTAADSAELTRLLNEFLSGASRNDAAMHDRFWAEDLIYTGSSGRRIGKADILKGLRSQPAPEPGEPKTTFTAEDVRIQQYGDVAIVAFRLMGATERKGNTEVSTFLNSGTFLKRDGEWRAVSWQATRVPRPDGEARESAAAAQALFHQALLAGDAEALRSIVDEGFTWTRLDGKQMTRAQLIEELGAGRLRYSKLQTSDVTVAVYGDTAVVRGITAGERSGAAGSGDAGPFTASYTLTLVGQGGGWKAVALHTSRP